ncbi:response regulator [Legionella sp.]|uniref:response regulator n=1 Tax=Legionella sp. TaxID=459 RepID=UPI003C8A0DF8
MPKNQSLSLPLLIIEDSLMCQHIYRAALGELNYQLELVDTAVQALDSLSQQAYSCIILDLGLPDKEGWELIPIIRTNPLNQLTPILVITAHADKSLQQQCIALGANEVCIKPVSPNKIGQLLKKHLDK